MEDSSALPEVFSGLPLAVSAGNIRLAIVLPPSNEIGYRRSYLRVGLQVVASVQSLCFMLTQIKMNHLTKQQEKLRGKNVQDMNSEELLIWINACDKMENWVKYNKARRSWTESRELAIEELKKRNTIEAFETL